MLLFSCIVRVFHGWWLQVGVWAVLFWHPAPPLGYQHLPLFSILQRFLLSRTSEFLLIMKQLSLPQSIVHTYMLQVDICKGDLNCLNYCFCQVSRIFCIVDQSPVCNTIYSAILTFKLWSKSSTLMPLRWNPYWFSEQIEK